MKKILVISIVILICIIASEFIYLYSIDKRMQTRKTISVIKTSPSPRISAWNELISSSSSQIIHDGTKQISQSTITYAGSVEDILYDKVYGGTKAPLTLIFNREKKLMYFFSEEDMQVTVYVLDGNLKKGIEDLSLAKNDQIMLTLMFDSDNQKKMMRKIILEKK